MDTLKLIAGGSPAAARMATDALRAQQNDSPMAQARAARAARAALEDPQATLSDEERRQIAELLEDDRDATIRFRVRGAERSAIERMAAAAGLSISELIRQRLGL